LAPVIEYDDYDGITVLFDRSRLANRYGERAEAFGYEVDDDLCRLMNDGDAAAFGTRDGGRVRATVAVGDGGSGFECGIITTDGGLALAGWHAFTYACDQNAGVVEQIWGGDLDVPAGRYAVLVERDFTNADEDAIRVSIWLQPASERDAPAFSEVPGNDGYF